MQLAVVSPHLLQIIKLLCITIDSLMPCSSCSFSSCIGRCHDDILVPTCWITTAPGITFNHLARSQPLLEIPSEDANVSPSSTSERTIDPANVTSLNANTHFTSKASTAKLVGVPRRAEWGWLLHWTIGAIDCQQACLTTVSLKAISKVNLTKIHG